MEKLLAFLLFILILIAGSSSSFARDRGYGYRAPSYKSYSSSVRVRGHAKRSGRYVMPHRRSRSDGRKLNNWSTKGNVNPYTGKKGTSSTF